jgi:hypothetical protein
MLVDELEGLICKTPGLTATELACGLFGPHSYGGRVSAECRMLAHVGRIERRGSGGPGDPYRYFPIMAHGPKTQRGESHSEGVG